MKILSIIYILVLLTEAPSVFSQREDYHWLLGYKSFKPSPDTSWGRCEFIFSDTSLKIVKTHNIINKLDFTNASISDSSGHLLFYTNGLEVYDKNYNIMPNGDDLNPGTYADNNEAIGYTVNGGALILPWPEHKDYYFIFHHTIDVDTRVWDWHAGNMLTTLVNMNLNNGLGDVVYKNKSVYKDNLTYGALTACRHSNGRDWWILCPYYTGKKMFIFLLDPNGLNIFKIQDFPFELSPGSGQSVFSPDGKKYSFIHFADDYREFFLCDFDRCTGEISNFNYSQIPKFDLCGVAFSPNNKYLYLATGVFLYQLDMNDSDPFKSKIQIDSIDGFQSFPQFPSYFTFMQLAPNGKIYICNGRGPKYLSTIEQPNLKGKACNLRQHNISIVANSTIPNFPYFRLGAMEGSTCDTLARGRLPIADWNGKKDSLNHLRFDFTDQSLYEVREWNWDFGDFSSTDNKSNLQNPNHTFSKDGMYNICLTVKNINGADTLCNIINTETVSTQNSNFVKIPIINISPNPCTDFFNVNLIDPSSENIIIQLYNNLGEKIKSKTLNKGTNYISTQELLTGIYVITVLEKGTVIATNKLLKL